MSPSPERKDKRKRHGTSVTTTGFESSRKGPPETSLCILCKGNTVSAHARTSWNRRSKKDWNFACQEEYVTPVLDMVTWHEAAAENSVGSL